MKLDFRNEEDADPRLIALDATTVNLLVTYCNKRSIPKSTVDEIHFGESHQPLTHKVGWATMIARQFGATIYFSHDETPIIAYPDIRTACFADYERRKGAGEKIKKTTTEPVCAVCEKDARWHETHRPAHAFQSDE